MVREAIFSNICHGVAVFLIVYSDQPAGPLAQECSTVSDHTGSDTDESIPVTYNQLLASTSNKLSMSFTLVT